MTEVDIRNTSRVRLTGETFTGIDGRVIYVENCENVLIRECHFEDVNQAVTTLQCTNVTMLNCTFRHLRGPMGWLVQFNQCDNAKVAGCSGINDPTLDGPQDIVSVFQSDNVRVLRNTFDGGGPSVSGSGIMLGDYGGSTILCAGNTLINPGQVGIGVAGGTNITVCRNRIYNEGLGNSNVGLYVENYGGPAMSGVTVRNNAVDWRRADDSLNPCWDSGAAGVVAGWDTNDWYATLNPIEMRGGLLLP